MTDTTTLDDHALCEQHPRASAALPDVPCAGYAVSGTRWAPCLTPAEWVLRGKRDWCYCTGHAARRLRRWDEIDALPAGQLVSEHRDGVWWQPCGEDLVAFSAGQITVDGVRGEARGMPQLMMSIKDEDCVCGGTLDYETCSPYMRWRPGTPALRFGGAS
jgi:hypothetical protein